MEIKKPTEAKRHHYIPQFILANFSNENKQVWYWDIDKKKLCGRNTKSIFMNFNMYRDEINNANNPTIIETHFSVFEREIADLLREKFIDKSEIVITREELEKLRIFMELLSFRSDSRMNQYKQKNFTPSTEELLSKYQSNRDFEDLWKKELRVLVDCRSYEDIEKSDTVDPIIKLDFMNLINGYYMTVVDARGGEFILSDIYPTLEVFPVAPGINIHLHSFFPISPTRMIILNHIMFKELIANKDDPLLKTMIKSSRISGDLLKEPKPKYKVAYSVHTGSDTFTYKPVKVYENDLTYINTLILNEVRNGIMFRNKDKIIESIHRFNKRDDTKTKHLEFEETLL